MFDRFKTIKCLRNDAEKVVIPKIDFDNVKIHDKSRHLRPVFRFAACTAVAAALVLTGTVWLPGKYSQPVSNGGKSAAAKAKSSAVQMVPHDFTLQVYAADASNIGATSQPDSKNSGKGKGVTLKDNLVVPAIIGKLEYSEKCGQDNGKWVSGSQFSGEGFLCTGDNLVSTTYTAANGDFRYHSKELIDEALETQKNATVCTIKIPKSELETGGSLFNNFKKLWDSGKFDEYRSKYFNGGDIDLDRYCVEIGIKGGSDWSNSAGAVEKTFIEDPVNTDTDSETDLVIIRDSQYPGFDKRPEAEGKSVTAKSSDHHGDISWSLSDAAWHAVNAADEIRQTTGSIDYSAVPGDTITVTGTFSDGQTVTKQIDLSFDKSGTLLAKLTDK